MSMCCWYATFLPNAADSLWGLWLLCCCSFALFLFLPFSQCYDCGSINTAWILPGPSYGLWLLLFFPLIPSICCTAERSDVAPTRLMLKICQSVMWWVFSPGERFLLGHSRRLEWGRHVNCFQAALMKGSWSVQKPFRSWFFKKRTRRRRVHAVFSEDLPQWTCKW